ncbi:hypothetical protein [Sphingomonas sp. 3-13AW]|uniref:hypothetical protein n=1 Tax=Sphingomonas sp. 3-13AW TaxID=3050450 RepID=UPI003BB7E2DC
MAAQCEEGNTPDRELELEIWRMNGGVCPPGHKPLAWLHCYTEQVADALALCTPAEAHGLMREALDRIARRFCLKSQTWPADVSYPYVLARFVTAAALRRIDMRRRQETGADIDLAYFELQESHLEAARTWLFASSTLIEGAGLDYRPMARIWDAIAQTLVREEIVAVSPGPVSDEMNVAGQAAYDRKRDDCWSMSPTEDPAAGGGPIGYAWRAMAKARKASLAS